MASGEADSGGEEEEEGWAWEGRRGVGAFFLSLEGREARACEDCALCWVCERRRRLARRWAVW